MVCHLPPYHRERPRAGQSAGRPAPPVEDSGQQEMLNWMCLAGAMAELGRRPQETEFVQSYIFNSNKVFALYGPV